MNHERSGTHKAFATLAIVCTAPLSYLWLANLAAGLESGRTLRNFYIIWGFALIAGVTCLFLLYLSDYTGELWKLAVCAVVILTTMSLLLRKFVFSV